MLTGGELMNILISNSSDKPIYDQIASQIKQMIINGELEAGAPLPSMRVLAKELRISVITTKRAYEDLERDGFIYSVVGKGTYVAEKNLEFVREEQLRIVEEHLSKAVSAAKAGAITLEELIEILKLLYEED
jgi:GntR family transcriptional regulator